MYRVLLVDDDSTMRIRLKNLVRWEELGCEIAGEAAHGLEAIAMIEKLHPDMMITDMYMPGMNGVDLIQYAREHYETLFILALSAYDDFDYVRNSLKYGAFDYVLKHQLTAARLEQVMREAMAWLRENRTRERPREKSWEDKELLERLLRGEGGGVCDGGSHCFLLALGRIEGEQTLSGAEEKKLRHMESIVAETLLFYEWKILCQWFRGGLAVLFQMEEQPVRRDMEEILGQVSENVERFIGIRLRFVLSPFYREPSDTGNMYRRLWEKSGAGGEMPETDAGQMMIRISDARELERLLEERDGPGVERYLNGVFDRLRAGSGSSAQISMASVELCNILQRITLRSKREPGSLERINEVLRDIQTSAELDQHRARVIALYRDFLREGEEPFPNRYMNEAVAYIEKNYMAAVSLQDVAEALNVNNAYLSRLFKKYTGKTVVTYINERKMERARELIGEGELSLKEIAAEVGFQNYNYFYQMFKKHYRKSPSELQ